MLAGVKTLSFEEMLRKTILAGLIDNSIMKKLENQKIDRVFWRFCEKHYGYKDSNPTIQKFPCNNACNVCGCSDEWQ